MEAIGGTLRVHVDGKAMLRVRDTTHAQGRAGVIMYRTRADYDNVVVSANPRTTLLHDDFEDTKDCLGRHSVLGECARSRELASRQGR